MPILPEHTEVLNEQAAQQMLIDRRWVLAALLFLAGLINYFDRTIISVAT